MHRLKPWVLPTAIVLGLLLNEWMGALEWLVRYCIFAMLLVTYCRISLGEFRHVNGSTWWLALAQFGGSLGLYFALRPWNEEIAQAAFLCVFTPTATAAPTVTGLLGGNVARTAAYCLLSHCGVALLAPVLLAFIGGHSEMGFGTSVLLIARNVLPLILGPLAVALLMERFAPRTHKALAEHQSLGFYLWALTLLIVVGTSVSQLMHEPREEIPMMLVMAGVAVATCACQFYIGHRIGLRYGDAVSATQSLGQKNTSLGIWLALTYLSPMVSAAVVAYIACHNLYNSYQIYQSNA